MKLIHPKIETAFTDKSVNILTIENQRLFREIFKDMFNAVNGYDDIFVLSDHDKSLNVAKYGLLIVDPVNIDFLDKKANSRLLSELSALAESKYSADIARINKQFIELIDKLNAESIVGIDWFVESPIQAMLKAFGVTVKDERNDDCERLVNYIDMFVHFHDIKLVMFVNLKSYFDMSELKELYKYLMYEHLLAVDLENCFVEKNVAENSVIIDKDLCEIIA